MNVSTQRRWPAMAAALALAALLALAWAWPAPAQAWTAPALAWTAPAGAGLPPSFPRGGSPDLPRWSDAGCHGLPVKPCSGPGNTDCEQSVAPGDTRRAPLVLPVSLSLPRRSEAALAGEAPASAPLPEGERPVPPAGRDIYLLPDDYRAADGTVDQAALVADQKRRIETINRLLGVKLEMVETTHYLLFSDADPRVTAQFAGWSEALYRSLLEQFALPAVARVWDGKCVLVLFGARRHYEAYARRFDGHQTVRAGAYFAVEKHGEGEPSLVHLCVPIEDSDTRRLQELFAHEGTHAFFELYKTPGRLPLWVHEGLAEYMTTVNDPSLRPAKWAPALGVARSRAPIDDVFQAPVGADLTLPQYGVAFTLVDCLLTAGRPKFKAFIDGLKDGQTAEAALQAAYGFGLEELAGRWRLYVSRGKP